MFVLDNWSYGTLDDPYLPPEALPSVLCGNCYNNPSFVAGTRISTSPILDVVEEDGEVIAITHNSRYVLATPDDRYLDWCRNKGIDAPAQHLLNSVKS